MFGARKTAVLFAAALLVGCESVSEPEVAPLLPQLGHGLPDRGSVSTSVTGSGHFLVGGQLRSFSFNALDQRGPGGATVVGQFQVNRASRGRLHGIITCFLIVGAGNEALIGGQVFRRRGGVVELGFRVVDNGPSGATPDQISFLVRPPTLNDDGGNPLADDAGAFCGPPAQASALAVPVFDIERGNITVRDNPPL